MASKNDIENIDLALKLTEAKLRRQTEAHQSLESKMGIIFGFIGVIAGSVVFLVLKDNPRLFGLNLFTLGALGIFASLVLLVLASKTREYLDPPDFDSFYSEEALKKDNLELKNKAVANMRASYETNAENHKTKAKFFNWGLYVFLVSLVLLFIGIVEQPNNERYQQPRANFPHFRQWQ
jgi:hypothetical protein